MTRKERELARKRSDAAKRAAATREKNRRAKARAEREARERRAEAARKGWETRQRKAREAEAAKRRKPKAHAKPKAKPKPKRRARDRAESARLGWERRREREAIQAEAVPSFATWEEEYTGAPRLNRTPRQDEAFQIGQLRLVEESARERREALEAGRAARESEASRIEKIRRELSEVGSYSELVDRIYEIAGEGDYSAHELFSLFYSPDAA